jgi:hypothetical protein
MKINLEGMKFNRLTVIGPAGTDGRQDRLWEWKCDCGGTTFATTSDLRHGHKKSCGCLKRVSHAKDITGQRFGMLTVMKRAGTNKYRKALWKCKCDCGRTTVVSSVDLVTGNTKSCGCLGKNYAKRNLMKGGYWYGKKDF